MKIFIACLFIVIAILLPLTHSQSDFGESCLQDCDPVLESGGFRTDCCGCCNSSSDDYTCHMIPEFATCCSNEQAFCGCLSFRAFCSGLVVGGAFQYNTFGTCYDPSSFTCAYDPSPNVWVLCPLNYTGCIAGSGNLGICCAPGTTCNTTLEGAQCDTIPPPSNESQPIQPLTCGSRVCGQSDQCCDDQILGPVCYDPTSYRCLENVLCGCENPTCNEGVCGTVCFDADLYTCCNNDYGLLGQISVGCAQPTQPTPQPTQSPSCGSFICGQNDQCCEDKIRGPVCFDPTSYRCLENVLCGCENPTCNEGLCGTICFNADLYTCCDNSTEILSQLGVACEHPTQPGSCGARVCGQSDDCCYDSLLGPTCFDPITYRCINNVLCGCENPTCNEGVCGTVCYNADLYSCCEDTGLLTQVNVSCPSVPQPPQPTCENCGENDECCVDNVLGPVCYDPNSFVCVRNEVLCGCENESCNEGACGTICFDADLYTCCLDGELSSQSLGCSN